MRCFYHLTLLFILLHTHAAVARTNEAWITVFIHGTFGIRSQLNLSTFMHILKDTIAHTPYKKVVHQIRNDPFFFKIQAIQDLGLEPIPLCKKSCSAASLFATLYEKNNTDSSTTKNLYYTYGWSGLLSYSERYEEAGRLYEALAKEISKIKRTLPKISIRVRLVCYSHGGSVALNLAQHFQPQKPLTIDELILLGTPVQQETATLVQHPLFLKAYNFYSRKDFIQKMDCFSEHGFFSHRCFKKECLHEKLVQVELKVMANKYPNSTHFHIDRSPNHTELWFFGWTLSSYRKESITYPIPTAAFIPNLLELIQRTAPEKKHLKLTLRPDGTASIKEKKHGHCYHANWIDPEKLHALQEFALENKPQELSLREHKAHLKSARKSTPDGLHKLQIKHSKECTKKSRRYHRCLCATGPYDLP